jgi:hypothetical protein
MENSEEQFWTITFHRVHKWQSRTTEYLVRTSHIHWQSCHNCCQVSYSCKWFILNELALTIEKINTATFIKNNYPQYSLNIGYNKKCLENIITVSSFRRSRNNQPYALICTTPLFYILASTCFGSSLPLSGVSELKILLW